MTEPAKPLDTYTYLRRQTRWHPLEFLFWLATLVPFVLFPNYLSLASQIAITALFALSVDLILGYAGIVSLGHAAFFGIGAYTAAIISKYGYGDPILGLFVAALVAGAVGYSTSFIVARFKNLALIMITLGMGFLVLEAANKASWLTGGADGPPSRRLGSLCAVSGRIPFACRRSGHRQPRTSARPIRYRLRSPASPVPYWRRPLRLSR
jgi:branched-chain amino acid transport system permease protein